MMGDLHLYLSRQQTETLKKVDQALKDVEYYRQVMKMLDIKKEIYLVQIF
jgi:5-bromo-4-chloroindolyl phosphate hydrolysis protein